MKRRNVVLRNFRGTSDGSYDRSVHLITICTNHIEVRDRRRGEEFVLQWRGQWRHRGQNQWHMGDRLASQHTCLTNAHEPSPEAALAEQM